MRSPPAGHSPRSSPDQRLIAAIRRSYPGWRSAPPPPAAFTPRAMSADPSQPPSHLRRSSQLPGGCGGPASVRTRGLRKDRVRWPVGGARNGTGHRDRQPRGRREYPSVHLAISSVLPKPGSGTVLGCAGWRLPTRMRALGLVHHRQGLHPGCVLVSDNSARGRSSACRQHYERGRSEVRRSSTRFWTSAA
jgi:hypothetical protein